MKKIIQPERDRAAELMEIIFQLPHEWDMEGRFAEGRSKGACLLEFLIHEVGLSRSQALRLMVERGISPVG